MELNRSLLHSFAEPHLTVSPTFNLNSTVKWMIKSLFVSPPPSMPLPFQTAKVDEDGCREAVAMWQRAHSFEMGLWSFEFMNWSLLIELHLHSAIQHIFSTKYSQIHYIESHQTANSAVQLYCFFILYHVPNGYTVCPINTTFIMPGIIGKASALFNSPPLFLISCISLFICAWPNF